MSTRKISLYMKQFFAYNKKKSPLALNINNVFYNYYFESIKKAIKYYEIFLLEKKISQPIQFLQHNFTLFPVSFLFYLIGLLELASKM